jgi:ribosomal protein S18 acetylase RimI-like enzyme
MAELKVTKYPDGYVIEAEEGNRFVGIVLCEVKVSYASKGHSTRRSGYISRLDVEKGYQRRGIGTCLLSKAEEISREEGMDVAVLVPEKKNLIKWYERRGYTHEHGKSVTIMGHTVTIDKGAMVKELQT